jgi:tRNA threonylcarbamoyladenosine biosynthesis protein TsaE
MKKIYLTKNQRETILLGRKIAQKIIRKNKRKKALVLALIGDLGGGKTTFLKGFARGLGIKEKILSPTFVLIKKFNIKLRTSNFKHFYHIDCYRIEKPKEILDLGLREIINNPKNIVAIEWADKIQKILPKKTFFLEFEVLGRNKRKISFYSK